MPVSRLLATGAGALALLLPATANAGTVTRVPGLITYQGAGGPERVSVGNAGPIVFVESALGATAIGCDQVTPERAECGPVPSYLVSLQGGDDEFDARDVTDTATLTVSAGAGGDRVNGTPNADTINGEDGDDTIDGGAGNDTINAGAGQNFLDDGTGNDTINGGPGNDTWHAGPGSDTFAPGDGTDTVDYTARTAPVAITLDGIPDDGEAGEGDNVGAAVEDASGGSGNDRIVGNNLGDRLHGGPGDDSISAGTAEDRVEGNEGNDTLDTRDGRYDSVDCGPGVDTLLADPVDFAENCEVAPDRDGDGYLNEADCAPDNAAVHPNAGEIVGNGVDEDCVGGPQYLRVVAPISFRITRKTAQARTRFVKLTVSEVRAGDTIEVRCAGGKRKGCPFAKKTVTGKAGKTKVDIAALLKKRYLHRNAVLEIRVLRANEIGRVQRFKIGKKGAVSSELLCLGVGATKPARCV